MKRCILILGAFSMMLLAGCTVGPRYTRPNVPTAPVDVFKETDGWKPAQPSDQLLRGNWWEFFGDPQLNALESEVTVSNQDLKVASARFVEARAMVHFNRAAQFPTISTSPGIESLRYSSNTPLLPANSFTNLALPFDLSYELDVWGRVRRTVSASREEAQATA